MIKPKSLYANYSQKAKDGFIDQPDSQKRDKLLQDDLEPYPDHYTHLLDELRWLNRLLTVQVLRLRDVNFYDAIKDFRGFFIADEEIDALIAVGIFEADGKMKNNKREKQVGQLLTQAQDIRQKIDKRVQKTIQHNHYLPFAQLLRCFNLSWFEYQTLVICLAPQIDARYQKLYAYVQNDSAQRLPGIDFILCLLCRSFEERLQNLIYFSVRAPLFRYGLLKQEENHHGTAITQNLLSIDPRILHFVLGQQVVDRRIASWLRFLPPLSWDKIVFNIELQKRLQEILQQQNDNPSKRCPVIYFHSRAGTGKKTVARALCGDLGFEMGVMDLRLVLKSEGFQEIVRLFLREGLLHACALYFDHFESLEKANKDNPCLLFQFIQEIQELGWCIFIGSENQLPDALLELNEIYAIEIPEVDAHTGKELWKRHLEGMWPDGETPNFVEITDRFELTPGQISYAVRLAKQFAFLRDPENGTLTSSDLVASSRAQSQPKLSLLARKIESKYRWSDIVLPDDQLTQLQEVTKQVEHRQIVMGEWGFAHKHSLGLGLNALFTGPSGTGKTMAAEVIANDLDLDLYKIDLSAVVSKYIGETEKNLNRVFSEAEHSSAILFFDEADALLGKRSEVKDAHDRYANIEVAFLLQKMEEYSGITILSTNLKKNIDDAFIRRIQFIVDFPFPDEVHRKEIWHRVFPEEVPFSDTIDFAFLAKKFKISGGNIKNIALKAAYYAAAERKKIKMEHLTRATRRELQKIGKLYSDADFGPYGYV